VLFFIVIILFYSHGSGMKSAAIDSVTPVLGLLAAVVRDCEARVEEDVLEVGLSWLTWVDDDVGHDSEVLTALYVTQGDVLSVAQNLFHECFGLLTEDLLRFASSANFGGIEASYANSRLLPEDCVGLVEVDVAEVGQVKGHRVAVVVLDVLSVDVAACVSRNGCDEAESDDGCGCDILHVDLLGRRLHCLLALGIAGVVPTLVMMKTVL